MEKVNERRRFVKGIGLFAAILGGGAAAGVAANSATMDSTSVPNHDIAPVSEPVIEDISHLAPPGDPLTLQITGSYGDKPELKAIDSAYGHTYYFQPINPVVSHSVAMAVGMDNRLWIKVGDTWKRVAIEG